MQDNKQITVIQTYKVTWRYVKVTAKKKKKKKKKCNIAEIRDSSDE